MGIIGRDRQEFRLQGEGGICPHGSGGGRPPNMVGRPCAGAWRTGPQTQYFTTPRGEPLIKFGSPGMMGADDGQAPPRRDATKLTPPPHTFPPRGETLEEFGLRPGHAFLPGGEPPSKF